MRSDFPLRLPQFIDPKWRIAIVHSSFYPVEMTAYVASAREALVDAGVSKAGITEYPVPGSFEIPLFGAALVRAGKVDALIGLGIIIQGETRHAEIIAREAARGMMDIQVQQGIPFACGILAVGNLAQAKARLDRGVEAAYAVLHALSALGKIGK